MVYRSFALLALAACVCALLAGSARADPERLSDERVVFQTNYGDIEFAFMPDVAPLTSAHIFKLATLGAYTGNHIFRVDKGFVAQVADVASGRNIKLNAEQQAEASKSVPLEVKAGVKHREGIVSMARQNDRNSNRSSFSFLLGSAPHLDMNYTIFGKVTKGMDVLHKLESLPTHRQGMFVMPNERVSILGTYWYNVNAPFVLGSTGGAAAAATKP